MVMIIDILVLVAWLTPILYFSLLLVGMVFNRRRSHTLVNNTPRKIEKIIFQIPTIGNYETTNRAIRIVKSYDLPVKVEAWVIVEEDDKFKDRYEADKIVVVPKDFECEDLFKARALEYARRLRKKMVENGELSRNYIVIQSDDDSYPSKEFVLECLRSNADIIVGSITPRPISVLGTIIDYERCMACNTFCNFFTNISKPIWGHGEGMCISSDVDLNVSYDVSDISYRKDVKLLSSEDLFYLHKAVAKGYTRIFNSEKRVFISPPLSLRDAIKQRRRWFWGHIRILKFKLLPLQSRIRILFGWILGFYAYLFSTLGIPLHYLGIIQIPEDLIPLTWATLILWLVTRGVAIGKLMGLKHGLIGMCVSHITVTLNFIIKLVGLIKGDPKKFEVIRKA